MTAHSDRVQIAERVRALVRDIPDYPEPGVVFKDITPLLADGPAFSAVIDYLAGCAGEIDLVAGMEARGFIFGAPVAHALGGTATATARLLEEAGAVVTRLAFLLEISALGGRALLAGREMDVILSA